MRKRSSYRPRGVNRTAHLVAIHGAALLSRDDRTVWALELRGALDAVREARATKAHWDTIFDSVNLAEELTRVRLASDPSGVIRDAQQACAGIIQRMQTTGTRAARAGGIPGATVIDAGFLEGA
jgi:hypothetical protein